MTALPVLRHLPGALGPWNQAGAVGQSRTPDQCWCSVTTPPGKAREGGEGLRVAAGQDRTKRKERLGGCQGLRRGLEQATDLREPPLSCLLAGLGTQYRAAFLLIFSISAGSHIRL